MCDVQGSAVVCRSPFSAALPLATTRVRSYPPVTLVDDRKQTIDTIKIPAFSHDIDKQNLPLIKDT